MLQPVHDYLTKDGIATEHATPHTEMNKQAVERGGVKKCNSVPFLEEKCDLYACNFKPEQLIMK